MANRKTLSPSQCSLSFTFSCQSTQAILGRCHFNCYLSHQLNTTPLLKGKTPFEVFFHKPPIYDHFLIFGYLCFASTHQHHLTKFDAKATHCLFLGYSYRQKGYRYDLSIGKFFISRDVLFHENVFPFPSFIADSFLVLSSAPSLTYDDVTSNPPSISHSNIESSLLEIISQETSTPNSIIEALSPNSLSPNTSLSTTLDSPTLFSTLQALPSQLT